MSKLSYLSQADFVLIEKNQGKDEPIREWIHIGDYVALKRCFFPVAFIIGDSQSQDKMCGRYLAYANVPRMCRACDVCPEDSDDPHMIATTYQCIISMICV